MKPDIICNKMYLIHHHILDLIPFYQYGQQCNIRGFMYNFQETDFAPAQIMNIFFKTLGRSTWIIAEANQRQKKNLTFLAFQQRVAQSRKKILTIYKSALLL